MWGGGSSGNYTSLQSLCADCTREMDAEKERHDAVARGAFVAPGFIVGICIIVVSFN
jgi:hypothetical protein